MESKHNVGIRSIGSYIPSKVLDSSYISGMSGIPEEVVREKFGIKQIHKAGDGESVSMMASEAAKRALDGLDPAELDLVVYCGSEYKDYYLYNCAAHIKANIGAVNAASFEIHNLCSAGVYSLKILKSMMLTDENIRYALLVSSSRESDLINYKDSESRFMFNFGDGAAAVLLERNLDRNIILESAMIVDGRFACDVAVPAVGSCNRKDFYSAPKKDYYLKVRDIKEMRRMLDPITFPNFIGVMESAIMLSGFTNEDVDFIAPIFMKRSILEGLLEHFGLGEENSFLLEDYGHCQSADCFLSIENGLRLGRLKDGDLAVLISAGTGYTWASTVIRWGKVK